MLIDCIRIIPVTSADIKLETLQYSITQKVVKFLPNSWPPNKIGVLQLFQCRRESLSVIDDYLMFADHVIPTKLKQVVLKELHSVHPVINQMKAIARCVVYSPNIDASIEHAIKSCIQCWLLANTGHIQSDHGLWCTLIFLALSIALVFWSCRCPRCPFKMAINLSNATDTHSTIAILRWLFCQHGLPVTQVSDNGLFHHFCISCCITHIQDPPCHPQSNIQTEYFVDTFKVL